MEIFLSLISGLRPATSTLAQRMAFPLLFLGAALVLVQPCAAAAFIFQETGSLAHGRYLATATLLTSGEVLVAGGSDNCGFYLTSAELYDPASGNWTATGSLAQARRQHSATLLPDGRVLVAGGLDVNTYLASAELYDPVLGTWTPTGSLANTRFAQTATLLRNGKVLVVGGASPSILASAELYDPASGTWAPTGSLANARYFHTATLLPDGEVLVAGGLGPGGENGELASAEIYDPASGTWTATGSLGTARYDHTATLLPNDKVLVAGGFNAVALALASAELYDPASRTWTITGSLNNARYYQSATLLSNGTVLVAGGTKKTPHASVLLASTELYNPTTGKWTFVGRLVTARDTHSATLLRNGDVLIAGGSGKGATLASAELGSRGVP